ncbi:MAG: tail fiber protein [Terracidiphilus sp.]
MESGAQNSFPASGNVVVTGNVQINPPAINNSGNGLYAGNGDAASASTADVAVESWWGLGFKSTCCVNSGITWNYPIVFDTRAGNIYAEGNVGIGTTAPTAILTIRQNAGTGNPVSTPAAMIDFKAYYTGYDTETVKASIRSGVDGTAAWNTQSGFLAFDTANAGTLNEALRISALGYVGIGTTSPGAKLEVDGNVKLSSGSGASITFQDGTVQTTAFTGVLCGGDYAESVDVTGDRKSYAAGDVLVIDPNDSGKFLKSAEPYSTAVLGIYSTKPGALGRRQPTPKSADEVPMAMIGIVPTKVSAENGAIKPGDLLVTSSTPGYAMLGTDRSRLVGAIIGKAMGRLDSGKGVMEVGVTLQ